MLKLEQTLDELAMLSLMYDTSDPSNVEMITSSLDEIIKEVESGNGSKILGDSTKSLLSKIKANPVGTEGDLNDFVSSAQVMVDNPDAPSNTNAQTGVESWEDDLSSQIDQELAIEFIEKHSLLLQEFEGHLMDIAQSETDDLEEEKAYIKSYLHNIKGDAGSVGFIGIQNVTHSTEEAVLENPLMEILEFLIQYREWVANILECYADGKVPQLLSTGFLSKIQNPSNQNVKNEVEDNNQAEEGEDNEPILEITFTEEEYQISGEGDILIDFLVEADEHLSVIENLLLSKEDDFQLDDLEAIFRAVHSIKGGSSYFGLIEITRSSHDVENLMDKARNARIVFNNALKKIILEYIDLQRELIEKTREAIKSSSSLISTRRSFDFINKIKDLLSAEALVWAESEIADVDLTKEDTSTAEDNKEPEVKETKTDETEKEKVVQKTSEEIKSKPAQKTSKEQKKSSAAIQIKEFVKVDTDRLDKLLEYIGEMVVSSSMLIKNCRDHMHEDEQAMSNTHQLERISKEIQQIGMSMRLVPIKGLFQKMSRVVWDTAKKVKKDIRFEMEGADTELDRSVIDGLTDPLMHMVRNAVDHGVESPEERTEAGKSKQGVVKLSAYHRAGSIYIEIKDDGKGLNAKGLINKAIEKGLISEGQNLSDEEAFMLIFKAGFSTAAQVTDVSGRGVGMDVVRRNIENMRGRVRIESELGKGSTFIIELPLTLAIMDGVETMVGEESYIIPSLSIIEFLHPTEDMIMHTLEKGETLKFRGQFLPIFRLANIFKIDGAKQNVTDGVLLILRNDSGLVALLVDSVLGKLSAVIKSLGHLFQDNKGLSGCAVMPNGEIGLIIDVSTLIEVAHQDTNVGKHLNASTSNYDQTDIIIN